VKTLTVLASGPGTVTINSPSGNDEVLYYNKLTIDFEVTRNVPWIYRRSLIYISGVLVTTTGSDDYTGSFYPEAYAGIHTIQITAQYIKGWQETAEVTKYAYFIVKNCIDATDSEDMRINELHDYESGKGFLDGNGVTICIIEDLLGANDGLSSFHKSLYHSGKNNIYGSNDRQYIDIKYLVQEAGEEDFYEDWDAGVNTKQKKWEELFDEGEGDYSQMGDVHGTYCMATMRQIAPAANYIFLEVGDGLERRLNAIKWLIEDRNDPVYDSKVPYDFFEIDIIQMSWSDPFVYDSLEDEFEDLADAGVISVSSAGQTEETIFYYEYSGYNPCSNEDVIGVTGVTDGNTIQGSGDRWEKDEDANTGYGVDIAAIYWGTMLDWEPVPDLDEFAGTSNACPMVAGIIALLEQYQNHYKSGTDLTVSIVQTLFEETGDEPGAAPSSDKNEISGYLDWINEYGSNPYYNTFPYYTLADYPTYNCGWGIIDGYEMYKYFRQNY